MKCWNGSGSAFLHGNGVQYCHDNLQQRRKNKTRNGRKQWKGRNKGWQDKPWQILSLSTSCSDSPSSAQAHLVSWIALWFCQSPLLQAPWVGDAALLMELFRCGILLAWWLLCFDKVIKVRHSAKSKDPAGQLSPLSKETCTSLKRTGNVVFASGVSEIVCVVCYRQRNCCSGETASVVKTRWLWWYLWCMTMTFK